MRLPDRSSFREGTNYAAALASELGGALLRGIDHLRRRSAPVSPSEWRRVLLLGAHHIGDVLYNTGSLPALRAGLPRAELHLAAPALARAALSGNPHLAGTVDPADLPSRAAEFDAAICYNSSSGWKEVLATWRAGIPNRAAYVHKGFSALVTHPIAIRRLQPYPAYFRDLVGQLTGSGAPAWPLRPLVYPNAEDEAAAEAFWRELKLDPARPVLASFVTSRQPSGVWPAERFGETIRHIHTRADVQSVLLGAAEDAPTLEALRARCELPCAVAAGRLPLLALVCFLRRCRAVLCTDSGPRHLANAAGARVLFVPNLAVGKIETGRYLETETDLAPGDEYVPIAAQAAAFSRIDPERVAGQVVDALRR